MTEGDDLLETLRQLREQLSGAQHLDSEVAARLRQTIDDIKNMLDRQSGDGTEAPDEDVSFSQRLSEAALHFEESHPKISATLGRLIDGLGQMGI
jgi:hypothetical protein